MFLNHYQFFLKAVLLFITVNVALESKAVVYSPGGHISGGSFEYDGIIYKYGYLVDDLTVVGFSFDSNLVTSLDFSPMYIVDFVKEEQEMIGFSGVETYVCIIGDNAFLKKNIENVTFPGYLEEIGSYSFAETSLQEVQIPTRVARIGEGAFKDCVNLGKINLAFETAGSIGYYGGETLGSVAFENCKSLKEISIPVQVTEIGEGAFRNCTGLEKVNLAYVGGGETCGSIGYMGEGEACGSVAFENCTNLKEIIIGNQGSDIPVVASPSRAGGDDYVVKLESDAFKGCSSIERIIVNSDVVVELMEDSFEPDVYENAIVCVPEGTVNDFKESEQWGKFKNIVDSSSSAIETVEIGEDNEVVTVYTLSGIKIYSGIWNERPELPKGVYVLHESNGQSRKIVVR